MDGDDTFRLMRLIIETDGHNPALDEYNPDLLIINRDNRMIAQFTTVEETLAAYDALSAMDCVEARPPGRANLDMRGGRNERGIGIYLSFLGSNEDARGCRGTRTSPLRSTGSVTVAIIDSGVSSHPFIGSRLIPKYDYVSLDSDPSDEFGHGTHVAGTVVDLTQGLNVYVAAYRVLNAYGRGLISNCTNAIRQAADDGCAVINLSLGAEYSSAIYTLYQGAIDYAIGKGATVCTASGNSGADTSEYLPAGLDRSGNIVVGSLDSSLTRATSSNYGASLDVIAPGVSIISCDYMGGYITMSGTSMATPHISATCAMVKLLHPGFSPSQVENYVVGLCVDLGASGKDEYYGNGIPDLSSLGAFSPESVAITAPVTTIEIGSGAQLTATVSPAAASQKVTWDSSDTTILTVNRDGTVTGVAPGSANITATTTNGLTASAAITVIRPQPTGVSISAPQTSLKVGFGTTLTASVTPALADQTVTWSSSNIAILTVSADGSLSGVSAGTATVTATTSNNLKATVDISVILVPTGVAISAPSASMYVETGMTLAATVSPAGVSQRVTWSTSDSSVLTVSESGVVSGIAVGKATVTAATGNGLNASVEITVLPKVPTGVTISAPFTCPAVGSCMMLAANVTPADASPEVAWSSSDESVLSVSAEGLARAVSVGTATITATTVNNLKTTMDIHVFAKNPGDVSIDMPGSRRSIMISTSIGLTAAVSPSDSCQTVTWSSSDEKIISVRSDGIINGVSAGMAKITAKACNGLTAVIEITVVPIDVFAVTVTAPSQSISLGTSMTLTETQSPAGADWPVTWSSSNSNILSVNSSGVVTAVSAGKATITAKTGNGAKGSIEITVLDLAPTGISISAPGAELEAGLTLTLSASLTPKNANLPITWASSDPGVLTVDAGGIVRGIREGTATVSARTTNGLTNFVILTVIPCSATGVSIAGAPARLYVGDAATLSAVIAQSGTAQSVAWSTSDPAVLSVNADGTLKALAAGKATIAATTYNNHIASVEITVLEQTATGVTINASAARTYVGEGMTLSATVMPSGAPQTVIWHSSDPSILTITESGSVTGVAEGSAIVSATVKNGLTASITIVVLLRDPTAVTISAPATSLCAGATMALTANLTPQNANPHVTWSTSNSAVLTVNALTGMITGVSAGTAAITVRTSNGLSDSATFTVLPKQPTHVAISAATTSLYAGTSLSLTATLSPSDADPAVTWSTTNSAVLAVNELNGMITGVSAGTATITVQTSNGFTDSATFTVLPKRPTRVFIDMPWLSLYVGASMQLSARLTPVDADPAVTWSTSNPGVLAVNALSGMITGVSAGTATITVRTSNALTETATITVLPKQPTDIALWAPTSNLCAGTSLLISAVLTPRDANPAITWSTSNSAVLAVNASSGMITGVSVGTATITARTGNGLTDSLTFTVLPKQPTGVTIYAPSTTLYAGSNLTLSANLTPEDAISSVVWSTSNPAVLAIDASSGMITGVSAGTATITVRTDNALADSLTFQVLPKLPTGVTLSPPPSKNLRVFTGMSLSASVEPWDANQAVTWSTSNASILTVDANGAVYGAAMGTATITATTANGLSSSVAITVFGLSAANATIGKAQTVNLYVINRPGAVVWNSSNAKIATVSSLGLVKGVNVGTATITAIADGIPLTCVVTVSKPILSMTSLTMSALMTQSLKVSYTTKSVKWSTSRSSVATVSSSGKITARKAGTAKITASVDGYKLTCTVNVQSNTHSYWYSSNAREYPAGASLVCAKVYYSGSTIYVDAYLVNNYGGPKMSKVDNLTVSVYDQATGKVLAAKNFGKVTARISNGKMMKITLKFTGSATRVKNSDLRLNTQTFTSKFKAYLY